MFVDICADFLDGKTRYYAGERVREANFEPEALAAYRSYGWLAIENVQNTPVQGTDVSLDVHSAASGHSAEEGA